MMWTKVADLQNYSQEKEDCKAFSPFLQGNGAIGSLSGQKSVHTPPIFRRKTHVLSRKTHLVKRDRQPTGEGACVKPLAPGAIWHGFCRFNASRGLKTASTNSKGGPVCHRVVARAGQPQEVAPCYVFLASDDASYMTGQALHPNGGEVIGG